MHEELSISSICAKQPVLGVGISSTSYQDVCDICRNWIDQHRAVSSHRNGGRFICVTSVHGIISAFLNSSFRETLNTADIATPDGMPVVWAMRSFGLTRQQRVYGPKLMLSLCEQAEQRSHRIFLYGAREETLQSLGEKLQSRFPLLVIAGSYSPPFRPLTPEEDAEVVRSIQQSRTDIVFVGLSTPKQENWMLDHRDKLPGVVMVGVGAAFDFHAGRVRQAPVWMQDWGLEWLFRFYVEPSRLWKRYLLIVPLFLPLWAMQKLGILKYGNLRQSSSSQLAS